MREPRIIYSGVKIDLGLVELELDDGRVVEREVVLHRGAVALLVCVDEEHLCLVRNRRFAVNRTLLEVPAGTIEPGESPRETARRELREETGYTARAIAPLASWWVSPGVMNERMHLFRCSELSASAPSPQADEQLETVIVSRSEALEMVRDGRIDDAKTMLALLLWERSARV